MDQLSKTQSRALELTAEEVIRAKELHPGEFHNAHEGYAVLLEEVRELEQAVFFGKKKCAEKYKHDLDPEYRRNATIDDHKQMMAEECIQIAAMAIRFHSELCK